MNRKIYKALFCSLLLMTDAQKGNRKSSLSRRQVLLGGVCSSLLFGFQTAHAQKRRPTLEQLITVESEEIDFATTGNGNFVWHPAYAVPWIKHPVVRGYRFVSGHPFIIEKYKAVYEKLRVEGNCSHEDFSGVEGVTKEDFSLVHTRTYLEKIKERAGKSLLAEFSVGSETPITEGTVQLQGAFVAGTYTAARIALEQGIAMNLGGGLHHAFPDHEEGFCIFNDVGIAVKRLQKEGYIRKAMIVDCDLHHGNGNATVFLNDVDVAIADIYQANNYPSRKIPVTLPIALDTRLKIVDDAWYLEQLPKVLDEVAKQQPDVVFYLAGADPFKDDRLGGFLLTKEGLQERDRRIINSIRSLAIPVIVLTAGGYSHNPQDVVDIHYNTAMVVKERVMKEQV